MIDTLPPDIALLCLGSMLIFAVGLLIVMHLMSRGKGKNEDE